MKHLIISDEVLREKFEEFGFELEDEILLKCKLINTRYKTVVLILFTLELLYVLIHCICESSLSKLFYFSITVKDYCLMFNYSEEDIANSWFAYNARIQNKTKKAVPLTLIRLEQFAKEDLVVKTLEIESDDDIMSKEQEFSGNTKKDFEDINVELQPLPSPELIETSPKKVIVSVF